MESLDLKPLYSSNVLTWQTCHAGASYNLYLVVCMWFFGPELWLTAQEQYSGVPACFIHISFGPIVRILLWCVLLVLPCSARNTISTIYRRGARLLTPMLNTYWPTCWMVFQCNRKGLVELKIDILLVFIFRLRKSMACFTWPDEDTMSYICLPTLDLVYHLSWNT